MIKLMCKVVLVFQAYAGFKVINGSPGVPTGVATGNWGCGAFKGNPRLKVRCQTGASGPS